MKFLKNNFSSQKNGEILIQKTSLSWAGNRVYLGNNSRFCYDLPLGPIPNITQAEVAPCCGITNPSSLAE